MDVLTKRFLQIILAANWLVHHSRTTPNQQRRPLHSLLYLNFFNGFPHPLVYVYVKSDANPHAARINAPNLGCISRWVACPQRRVGTEAGQPVLQPPDPSGDCHLWVRTARPSPGCRHPSARYSGRNLNSCVFKYMSPKQQFVDKTGDSRFQKNNSQYHDSIIILLYSTEGL